MSGILFLIVGPSGAGKDTLLNGARAALVGRPDIVFARRTITRPADAGGELHESLTEAAFELERARGAFALDWAAHGLRYGIRRHVDDDLAVDRCVVASVSRQVIDAARRRFDRVQVVEITAAPEILAERLARRGREKDAEIGERLRRAGAIAVVGYDVTRIDNSGPIAAGVTALTRALTAGLRIRPVSGRRHSRNIPIGRCGAKQTP